MPSLLPQHVRSQLKFKADMKITNLFETMADQAHGFSLRSILNSGFWVQKERNPVTLERVYGGLDFVVTRK